MTKKKELEFITEEMGKVVGALEKRETLNTQLIDELDKQLTLTRYGSVGHVTKVVRLSSLRNYKLRLKEVIDTFKQITDYESIETIEGYVVKVLNESKESFKNASVALNGAEVFSNDYIKNEILVNTFKDVSEMYAEVLQATAAIKEATRSAEEVEEAEEVVKGVPTPKATKEKK